MSVAFSLRCLLNVSWALQLICADWRPSFRLRDGEFMQPMGTASSRAQEPSTITSQGQLVAGSLATSLDNLQKKLSYNLPVGQWENRSTRPWAIRPMKDGRVALVSWSARQRCYAVFICDGPVAEHCTSNAHELPVDCALEGESIYNLKIWELSKGLAVVSPTQVFLWSADAVLRGEPPVSHWSGNFTESLALHSEGLALKCCNGSLSSCRFFVLHMSVSHLGIDVWMQALQHFSPPDQPNLLERPASLHDGGLAIASRFGRRGACYLEVVVFPASTLSSGTSVFANASGRAQVALPSDPCEEGLGQEMLVETVVHNGSDFLLVFSDTALHRFPIVQGTVGRMTTQVFPPSDMAAAVVVLPENVLAVAFAYSIRLGRFTDGNFSWLGMPLQVRDGSISVLAMFPWGRSGLCVLDDTYYFFNYSAATRGAASLWQTTVAAPANPQQSTQVNNLIGIAGGFVALIETEHSMNSSLVFLTNSTPHGDWTTAVLGVAVHGRHSNSIVAVSSTILACSDDEAKVWSFWDLSQPRGGSEDVLKAFCTLPAPFTTPGSGQLLGSTGRGDLIVANASGLLILPAAGIRRCDLSFLVHLRSPDPTRAYAPLTRTGSAEVLAVPCCGGGAAVVHSGIVSRLKISDRISLFNASAVERGGEPFADLQVDSPQWVLITSLLPLLGGGFLVGTTEKKVYRYEPVEAKGLTALNASTAFNVPGVPWYLSSWAGSPENPHPEIFVADQVVYRAQRCPEMTYGHLGECLDCPESSLSIQGSTSCGFRPCKRISGGGGGPGKRIALALFLGLAVVAVALLVGRSLEPKLLRLGPGGLQGARALAFASALLPVCAGWVDGIFGPAWASAVLVFLALLALATEHWMWRREGLVEILAITGPLLWMACNALTINFMLLLDYLSELRALHPMLTLLGQDRGESRWFYVVVLASEAVVIAAATAWHPKVQRTAPGRPLSRGLLYTEPWDQSSRNFWSRGRCLQRCSGFSEAVSQICGRARRFLKSWQGRHWVMVVNACISTAVCTYQYLQSDPSPRETLLAVVLCFGLLSIFTSAFALSSDAFQWEEKLDRHFRWSVLWKVDMLASKVVLLAIPQASSVVQMDSIKSCGFDAFCPSDCVNQGGYCTRSNIAGSPVCKCSRREVNWAVYVLTAITSFLLCMLTMDLAAFWSARLTPWRESGLRRLRGAAALVGAAGVNLTSCFFALLVSVAPAECYLLDLPTALCSVLPLIPLTLVANEARWILATWKAQGASAVSFVHLAWKPTEDLQSSCRAVHWSTLSVCFLCVPFSIACCLIRARSPVGRENAPCEGLAESHGVETAEPNLPQIGERQV
eukprot:s417_g6.t3